MWTRIVSSCDRCCMDNLYNPKTFCGGGNSEEQSSAGSSGRRQTFQAYRNYLPNLMIFISALWFYPHVKVSIRDLSQILTTAPIFLYFNFFRQKYLEIASCAVSLLNKIWVRVEHSPLQQLDLEKLNCSSSSLQAGCE